GGGGVARRATARDDEVLCWSLFYLAVLVALLVAHGPSSREAIAGVGGFLIPAACPFTSLFIVARRGSRSGTRGRRLGRPDAHRLGPLASLPLPALHGLAQLEEGDDAGRNRQPEGDHAVGEDCGEDLRAGQPEQDERADHAGVDRAHPARREREEVGQHPEEEPL